jgi:hypothetical protein
MITAAIASERPRGRAGTAASTRSCDAC